MSFSYKILCRNIRKARKTANLTQQEAAALIGISALHYGRLERGDRSASIAHIERIAAAFHISSVSLFDGCFDRIPSIGEHTDISSDAAQKLVSLIEKGTSEEIDLCIAICKRIILGK